jgi:excisionase family DNA binding protein
MKPLLTCSKVCELLEISPATLSRMIRKNQIPFILLAQGKTKKSVRFSEADLERWLERRSRGPVPPKRIETMETAALRIAN